VAESLRHQPGFFCVFLETTAWKPARIIFQQREQVNQVGVITRNFQCVLSNLQKRIIGASDLLAIAYPQYRRCDAPI
jgi:hypothetical protein